MTSVLAYVAMSLILREPLEEDQCPRPLRVLLERAHACIVRSYTSVDSLDQLQPQHPVADRTAGRRKNNMLEDEVLACLRRSAATKTASACSHRPP